VTAYRPADAVADAGVVGMAGAASERRNPKSGLRAPIAASVLID
jgi:hypothetical protein